MNNYQRQIDRLFDKLITASREKRPAIERELQRLQKLAAESSR